ncbi:hypothetical protein BJX61DRAFT_79900 [Aspergillus egyptiacus]|nr:hypothetical protein BJX61DRAFT_79900 [Aspergillus egyptiacus]
MMYRTMHRPRPLYKLSGPIWSQLYWSSSCSPTSIWRSLQRAIRCVLFTRGPTLYYWSLHCPVYKDNSPNISLPNTCLHCQNWQRRLSFQCFIDPIKTDSRCF